jgi:hypothetical protein
VTHTEGVHARGGARRAAGHQVRDGNEDDVGSEAHIQGNQLSGLKGWRWREKDWKKTGSSSTRDEDRDGNGGRRGRGDADPRQHASQSGSMEMEDDRQAGAQIQGNILATASSPKCLVALAEIEEGGSGGGAGARETRAEAVVAGRGVLTASCVDGGGLGVSGEDADVVVPLDLLASVAVYTTDRGGVVYRLLGAAVKEGGVGAGHNAEQLDRQLLMELSGTHSQKYCIY